MKNVILIALLCSGLSLTQSCSKEEGPVGPQGPAGLTGATGATGQNGISGAVAFEYINRALPFSVTIPITQGRVDSSAIMVYYQDTDGPNIWYQAPGLGRLGDYQTRYYIEPIGGTANQSFSFGILDPDGTDYSGTTITASKVKVVFIPYTLTGKKENIDLNDYKATMKYYGLAE